MLGFVIRSTAVLLGIAATLVILGTFDAQLGWDIFDKELESVLYGVLFSSLALAAVGIALSFVLGIQELVVLLRASLAGGAPPAQRPMRHYVRLAGTGLAILAVGIGLLEVADRRIQVHRRNEFKRLAGEQVERFLPKLAPELPRDGAAPVPSDKLVLLLETLDNVDFISDATLYVADPGDPEVLWTYGPHTWYVNEKPAFKRVFVSRSTERAARRALDGDLEGIAKENARDVFRWLAPVGGADLPRAVLLVTADESQNFRDFIGSR